MRKRRHGDGWRQLTTPRTSVSTGSYKGARYRNVEHRSPLSGYLWLAFWPLFVATFIAGYVSDRPAEGLPYVLGLVTGIVLVAAIVVSIRDQIVGGRGR
jgi:hypothetical protein